MSNRKGFTLIELLIVVVIIGILAAIAIPKFANTKEKAILASMKSDLRNLVTAQEGFFSDNQTYSTTLGAAQVNTVAGGACGGTVAFQPSSGNTVKVGACTAAGCPSPGSGGCGDAATASRAPGRCTRTARARARTA